MKKYFVTYTTPDYSKAAESSVRCAESNNFDYIFPKRPEDIAPFFYQEHKAILDLKQHAGCCLWKPYFILGTMFKMEEDDFLLYMDATDTFSPDMSSFALSHMNHKGMFFLETQYLNRSFTRRNCFKLMKCDSEKYWEGHQVEAGCIGLIKNGFTLKFVSQWLQWCTVPDIIVDMGRQDTGEQNFHGYSAHRCDQSVLSILIIKNNMTTTRIGESEGLINHNILHDDSYH